MRIVVKNVREAPKVVVVNDDIDVYHEIVSGCTGTVFMTRTLLLIVNDDGLSMKLPLNFMLDGKEIVGNVFFVNVSRSSGKYVPLTTEDILTIFREFGEGQSEGAISNEAFKEFLSNTPSKGEIFRVLGEQPTEWDIARLKRIMEK